MLGKQQLTSYEHEQLELIYLITGHVDMLYSIYLVWNNTSKAFSLYLFDTQLMVSENFAPAYFRNIIFNEKKILILL